MGDQARESGHVHISCKLLQNCHSLIPVPAIRFDRYRLGNVRLIIIDLQRDRLRAGGKRLGEWKSSEFEH